MFIYCQCPRNTTSFFCTNYIVIPILFPRLSALARGIRISYYFCFPRYLGTASWLNVIILLSISSAYALATAWQIFIWLFIFFGLRPRLIILLIWCYYSFASAFGLGLSWYKMSTWKSFPSAYSLSSFKVKCNFEICPDIFLKKNWRKEWKTNHYFSILSERISLISFAQPLTIAIIWIPC